MLLICDLAQRRYGPRRQALCTRVGDAIGHLRWVFLCFFPLALVIAGCAPQVRPPVRTLGTPEHHVATGMKLLEGSKLIDAEREFNLARELDPEYSPASMGLGLVLGCRGDFESAFDTMCQAQKLAKSKKEEILAYVGFMRLHTQQKDKDWLEHVRGNFERARKVLNATDMPDPYFYMGLAYKEASRFSDAVDAFKRVLEINQAFSDRAERQLRLVQKIERAMPGTPIGKKVALLEKVRRVDVAALFIQELELDKAYKRFGPGEFDISLESAPERTPLTEMPTPVDVQDHPLRADVLAVIGLGVKGLCAFPDGTFAPNEPVTRADYAVMISDIIAALTRDRSLATRYIGEVSPFADVRNDVPYFNAVMVCTTRGIIEPRGKAVRGSIFDPKGGISGADALLAIRRLKEDLRIF